MLRKVEHWGFAPHLKLYNSVDEKYFYERDEKKWPFNYETQFNYIGAQILIWISVMLLFKEAILTAPEAHGKKIKTRGSTQHDLYRVFGN